MLEAVVYPPPPNLLLQPHACPHSPHPLFNTANAAVVICIARHVTPVPQLRQRPARHHRIPCLRLHQRTSALSSQTNVQGAARRNVAPTRSLPPPGVRRQHHRHVHVVCKHRQLPLLLHFRPNFPKLSSEWNLPHPLLLRRLQQRSGPQLRVDCRKLRVLPVGGGSCHVLQIAYGRTHQQHQS